MIVHRIGQDTRVDYDWTDDDDIAIVVSTAALSIDGSAADLLTINGDYPVSLHIPDNHAITAGNHAYAILATDAATGDTTILSAGLLRVK